MQRPANACLPSDSRDSGWAMIRAVVESFTKRFEAVAQAANTDGGPRQRLARHMRSSVELMRTSPQMFVVLNEIMIKARRDDEICKLVLVPLTAWRDHIVSLLSLPANERNRFDRSKAEETAAACMAQLLGMGLLLISREHAGCQFDLRGRLTGRPEHYPMRVEAGMGMYESFSSCAGTTFSRTRLSSTVKVASSSREKDAKSFPNLAMATPNASSTTISPSAGNRAISFRRSSVSPMSPTSWLTPASR